MGKADDLRSALRLTEETLKDAVLKYRLALGCCYACGDYFEFGAAVIVVLDEDSMVAFEHESCPEDAEDYRSSYRNPQQLDRPSPSEGYKLP